MFEVRPVCDCSRRGTECGKDDGQEGCDRKKHAKGAHLIKKRLADPEDNCYSLEAKVHRKDSLTAKKISVELEFR